MTDAELDQALIQAGFEDAAIFGWRGLSLPRAAQAAGLDLAHANRRIPTRAALLLRFGQAADQAALAAVLSPGDIPREQLFDMLMRRFDALQAHRPGILALLAGLPLDPPAALLLGAATLSSMNYLAQAAGLASTLIQAPRLAAAWLWTLRSWQSDISPDLSATMAALDTALARAGVS